jgi:multicomponent Na+:H+ antiporter subunit E
MPSSFLKSFLAKAIALFVIWLLLSGRYNPVHVILGGLSACVVAWLNTGYPHSPFQQFPWFRWVWYLPWLFFRIVHSSLHLTRIILSPRMPIRPKLINYTSSLTHQAAVVTLGNSVTLTPGTLTVDVNGHELIVHAIDEESGADLTQGRMERKVAWVFHNVTGHQ